MVVMNRQAHVVQLRRFALLPTLVVCSVGLNDYWVGERGQTCAERLERVARERGSCFKAVRLMERWS